MDKNIYRTYDFNFDKNVYMKNFREALEKSDVAKLSKFDDMLRDMGIKNYDFETVKSYFYGRRALPLNVFIAVCKKLRLSADEIAFPNSVQIPQYTKDICECEDLFRNIFYPYNPTMDGSQPYDLIEFFDAETYKSDVDKLALILSRYNYLIQKYHYASVSTDEFVQIFYFTQRYIIDRSKREETDFEGILDWIQDYRNDEFLYAFYEKYTLGFYGMSCHSLLEILSTAINDEFIIYAKQLFPVQDR